VIAERIKANLVGKSCRLDKVANKVTYGRAIDGLRQLCGQNDGLNGFRQLLLAQYSTGPQPELGYDVVLANQEVHNSFPVNSKALQGINGSQQQALAAASCRRLTLIQGPPGTGKTHTSVRLIKIWVETGRGPVLATADSNIAVDNLLSGCIEAGLIAIRIGRPEAIRPELEDHVLDLMAKKNMGPGCSADDIWKAENQLLKMAQVICCTCSGAASGVIEKRSFTSVLIDEVAQSTEPTALIPIVRGGTRQVALVGDHKQLPPTVISRIAEQEGLSTSMFDRLVQRGVRPWLLDVQYRMHPAIAAFPSHTFYEGKLQTGISSASRPAVRGIPWPNEAAPLCFVPAGGREVKEGVSYSNQAEAQEVGRIVKLLLDAGEVTEEHIGVISPYAAQVRQLRRIIGGARPGQGGAVAGLRKASIEVSSVDGFQGREKEVIIITTVRANPGGELGFVKDLRRMNVSLTRAKRGLIVVGHQQTLGSDPHGWGPWLQWMSSCGLVHGEQIPDAAQAQNLLRLCGAIEDEGPPAAKVRRTGGFE